MNSIPAQRILVIKLSALGDFVLSIASFQAIRAHHPNATITLLTTAPYRRLAKKSGCFDDIWLDDAEWEVLRENVRSYTEEGSFIAYLGYEWTVNTTRGGHHNSVTRAVMKPTHMIGGYAQQSYGFNYYGTVGCNRDEFVVVRKMSKVDWLDGSDTDDLPQPLPQDI